MPNELEVQPGETSEQFLMRIQKAQADLSNPQPVNSGKAQVLPEGQTPPAKSEPPQPIKPAEKGAPSPNNDGKSTGDNVDPQEWMKKKGFKSEEDIVRSYRAMEEEFHRRNQGKWNQQPPPTTMPPPPANVPPPNYGQPNYGSGPNYVPSPPPPPAYATSPTLPPQAVAELSRIYNIPPDDVQRLYAFNKDMMDVQLRNALTERDRQWNQALQPLQSETKRNSEFRKLMQDPVFKDPEVQMEMEKVLNEDPDIFTREPEPFVYANREALARLARRDRLSNGVSTNGFSKSDPLGVYPPSRPPTPMGKSSGEQGTPDEGMTYGDFSKLSLEDQRRFLASVGAVEKKY